MVQVLHLEFGLSVRERLAITCDIRSRVAEAVEEAATAAVRERLRGGMIDLSKKFGMDYATPTRARYARPRDRTRGQPRDDHDPRQLHLNMGSKKPSC